MGGLLVKARYSRGARSGEGALGSPNGRAGNAREGATLSRRGGLWGVHVPPGPSVGARDSPSSIFQKRWIWLAEIVSWECPVSGQHQSFIRQPSKPDVGVPDFRDRPERDILGITVKVSDAAIVAVHVQQ